MPNTPFKLQLPTAPTLPSAIDQDTQALQIPQAPQAPQVPQAQPALATADAADAVATVPPAPPAPPAPFTSLVHYLTTSLSIDALNELCFAAEKSRDDLWETVCNPTTPNPEQTETIWREVQWFALQLSEAYCQQLEAMAFASPETQLDPSDIDYCLSWRDLYPKGTIT